MVPALMLLILSIGIVFMLNVPYRFLMNHHEAASVKARAKELQERSRAAQKDGNQALASKLMHESLAESGKITKLTLKPMLASLVVVALVLPMMGNPYNDVAIAMQDGKGEAKVNGNVYNVELSGNYVTISTTDSRTEVQQIIAQCTVPCRKSFDSGLWNVVVEDNKVVLQRIVALLPVSLPFFNDDLGWLGWYFFVSIPMMIITRKMMKINI